MPLIIVAASILLLLFLNLKKLSPMLALLIVSILAGFALGMPANKIIISVQNGLGSTLGSVALVIVLGAILGKWMEESGAAHRITSTLVKKFGINNVQWAVLATGFLVGIPMFYNAGFVILVPLIFTLAAETGLPLIYLAIPMGAALSITHGLLPPHPSPVALSALFHANVGKIMTYGLIIAIPISAIAGPLFGRRFKNIKTTPFTNPFAGKKIPEHEILSATASFFVALLPIFIILICVAFSFLFPSSSYKPIFDFTGDPVVAFLLSVITAMFVLIQQQKTSVDRLMKSAVEAVSGIAVIIMIIGSGGVFKQVLIDSGVGEYIKGLTAQMNFSPLLLGWLVAAFMRVTLGSATVAGLTAAGIVAPIVLGGSVSPELMVLSVGAGSLMFSHVNDTGFWMFKEYFNLSIKETFLSWTLMETIVSILGLIGVLLINQFI